MMMRGRTEGHGVSITGSADDEDEEADEPGRRRVLVLLRLLEEGKGGCEGRGGEGEG